MSARRALVGVGLLVLLVLGVVLVVTGGDDGTPTDADGSASPAGEAPDPRPDPTLPIDDLSVAGVEELSGLAVPDDAADFLTAKLDDDQQLDVTFTMAPDEEEAFLAGSGLPPMAVDARVITHSSPLWKLTPEGQLRGGADIRDGVNRAVELVEEGDRVRVRVTLRAV